MEEQKVLENSQVLLVSTQYHTVTETFKHWKCVCVHVSVCVRMCIEMTLTAHHSLSRAIQEAYPSRMRLCKDWISTNFNIFQLHPFKSQTIQIADSEIAHITSHCPHLAAHPASARKVCQPETLCLCAFNVPLSDMSTSASNLLSVFRYQSSVSPNDRKF